MIAEKVVVRTVQRRGRVFASAVLIASMAVVSVETRVSGPTIGCPFSLLALVHLHPGTIQIFWGFGWGYTAY